MKVQNVAMIALLHLVASAGCGKTTSEPGPHTLELHAVQFAPQDFNLNAFGSPFNIRVDLFVDGKRVEPREGDNILSGSRGERNLEKSVVWDFIYASTSRYQVQIEEQNIISPGVRWSIPATPRMGDLIFGASGRRKVDFGKDSYLGFNCYRR
jgi:hypothetical protein